jgi:hypothetical protein
VKMGESPAEAQAGKGQASKIEKETGSHG